MPVPCDLWPGPRSRWASDGEIGSWGGDGGFTIQLSDSGEDMQVHRKRRLSAAALVTAFGVAVYGGSMISTDVASATVPASPSVNCTASDGKINGRGSTYQTIVQGDWLTDFANDVCGSVATQYSGDPSGS